MHRGKIRKGPKFLFGTRFFHPLLVERDGARAHGPNRFGEFGHHPGELLSFGRRDPFQVEPPFQSRKPKDFLEEADPLQSDVITVQVMAVAQVSAAHQDAVGAALKRPQNVMRGYGGRTHDANGPDVNRVTQSAHPGKVRRPVGAPVAKKGHDPGFETAFFHLDSPRFRLGSLPACPRITRC